MYIGVFGCADPLQTRPMSFEKYLIIQKDDISQIMPEDIISKVTVWTGNC